MANLIGYVSVSVSLKRIIVMVNTFHYYRIIKVLKCGEHCCSLKRLVDGVNVHICIMIRLLGGFNHSLLYLDDFLLYHLDKLWRWLLSLNAATHPYYLDKKCRLDPHCCILDFKMVNTLTPVS